MIPGMWGAPLKALSGYLPPLSSQDFVIEKYAPATTSSSNSEIDINSAKYSDFLHLPHNLKGFFDMKEAEAYAAKVGKPIFIDFTGHGCVNCREMEARVWADPTVQQILRDEYVIVALYTDDKMPLPESDWVTTDDGKVLKTLGKKNSNYALKRFNVAAQPYYVLQGKDGEILGNPRGYDLSVDGFVKFLRDGVQEYKKSK
jgi:thiol:disulfide interchange protein DsbD